MSAADASEARTEIAASLRLPVEIFVAIDDAESSSSVRTALASDDVHVHQFTDAESLLECATQDPPDLVLIAPALPGPSSMQVARRLRSDERTREVPILVVSGQAECKGRLAAFAAGADCFLASPYTVDELRAVVRSLSARGHRLRDLEPGSDVLYALAEIVDVRGMDLSGHMERSARMARAFGEMLGLPETDQVSLERAGYVHDIGKVGIPLGIINKPGKLTAGERKVMEQHTVIGARICEHLTTLSSVVPVILHHHERWDGTGYPDKLEGEAIPMLARVFQVVDIYDALTSVRCYKSAIEPRLALEMLKEEAQAGSWDLRLVGHFEEALTMHRITG